MIRVSIVGGSGYVGGEALRLLLDHPEVASVQERVDGFVEEISKHPDIRIIDRPAAVQHERVFLNRVFRHAVVVGITTQRATESPVAAPCPAG